MYYLRVILPLHGVQACQKNYYWTWGRGRSPNLAPHLARFLDMDNCLMTCFWRMVYVSVYVWAAEVTSYKQLHATKPGAEVRGIALLDDHLYVVYRNSSQIHVLHPTTLTQAGSIPVSGMTNPGSMVGCSVQKSLFITCFKQKEVLKIHVAGMLNCVAFQCIPHLWFDVFNLGVL